MKIIYFKDAKYHLKISPQRIKYAFAGQMVSSLKLHFIKVAKGPTLNE